MTGSKKDQAKTLSECVGTVRAFELVLSVLDAPQDVKKAAKSLRAELSRVASEIRQEAEG